MEALRFKNTYVLDKEGESADEEGLLSARTVLKKQEHLVSLKT